MLRLLAAILAIALAESRFIWPGPLAFGYPAGHYGPSDYSPGSQNNYHQFVSDGTIITQTIGKPPPQPVIGPSANIPYYRNYFGPGKTNIELQAGSSRKKRALTKKQKRPNYMSVPVGYDASENQKKAAPPVPSPGPTAPPARCRYCQPWWN